MKLLCSILLSSIMISAIAVCKIRKRRKNGSPADTLQLKYMFRRNWHNLFFSTKFRTLIVMAAQPNCQFRTLTIASRLFFTCKEKRNYIYICWLWISSYQSTLSSQNSHIFWSGIFYANDNFSRICSTEFFWFFFSTYKLVSNMLE